MRSMPRGLRAAKCSTGKERAVCSSVRAAATCGWIWLVARAYYPLVFALPFPAVLLSTLPSYLCVAYMIGSAVLAL